MRSLTLSRTKAAPALSPFLTALALRTPVADDAGPVDAEERAPPYSE
jgi:hypothetical protein